MPSGPLESAAPSSRRASGEKAGDAAGFVLAGGESARMGEDKALLLFAGQPLVQRALLLLREAGISASIAGAQKSARANLAQFAPVIDDPEPDIGPLAGICAAMASTSANYAVFLPVDLPLLPSSLVVYLLHHACISGHAVTLATVSGFTQTFPSVLDRAVLPILKAELDAGRRGCFTAFRAAAASMGQSISGIAVEYLAQSGQVVHSLALPPFRWFLNLNRRQDLVLAESLLAKPIA